jgi:hypothetical protein
MNRSPFCFKLAPKVLITSCTVAVDRAARSMAWPRGCARAPPWTRPTGCNGILLASISVDLDDATTVGPSGQARFEQNVRSEPLRAGVVLSVPGEAWRPGSARRLPTEPTVIEARSRGSDGAAVVMGEESPILSGERLVQKRMRSAQW